MPDVALDIGRDARDRAARLLVARLGPSKVSRDADICESFRRDDSPATGQTPDAVVMATSMADVAATLDIARETGVFVTPRAAGTGRSGGATPVYGGIVLCLTGMNQIKDIDRSERIAIVEPGVILADLHRAVEAEGLFYPPDPSSLGVCTLGGNVAENAGGPRAFKYGVTRDYVLGLDLALAGGQQIFCGRRTAKGVTGYDVTSLVVGSEGTLGVVGDIVLRLVPQPESVTTLVALFRDVHTAAASVTELLGLGTTPRCLELLDAGTLSALRAAGQHFHPAAHALLLVEVDGDIAECERHADRVGNVLTASGALEVLVASEGRQRSALWAARREMSRAIRGLANNKLSEDIVVPRKHLPDLLDRLRLVTDRLGVRSVAYGHAGDGNLHVNYLWDHADEKPRVLRAIEALFADVVALGGTLTGEHGIGVMKAPYLHLEQSPELIALQRDLKRAFDPAGLVNPGKIFARPGHAVC